MSLSSHSPVADTRRPLSLALGGLVALATAVGIGRFVYTPILPLMAEDPAMTKGAAGVLASANFLGYLAGALLAATPLLPGSRRTWLMIALTLSAFTTGAMAFASSNATFLTLRFVGGMASAFVLVFASALVLDRLHAAGRPDLAAVHFAGVGAGIALSAVLVSSLTAWAYGWRALWLASGLTALVTLGIVARLVPDRVEPVSARRTWRAGHAWPDRPCRGVWPVRLWLHYYGDISRRDRPCVRGGAPSRTGGVARGWPHRRAFGRPLELGGGTDRHRPCLCAGLRDGSGGRCGERAVARDAGCPACCGPAWRHLHGYHCAWSRWRTSPFPRGPAPYTRGHDRRFWAWPDRGADLRRGCLRRNRDFPWTVAHCCRRAARWGTARQCWLRAGVISLAPCRQAVGPVETRLA